MKPELEGLILAREALLNARSGDEAKRARDLYNIRLDTVLERFPNLSRRMLESMIEKPIYVGAMRKTSRVPFRRRPEFILQAPIQASFSARHPGIDGLTAQAVVADKALPGRQCHPRPFRDQAIQRCNRC